TPGGLKEEEEEEEDEEEEEEKCLKEQEKTPERARVERQYAQQLAEWSGRWKPLDGDRVRSWQKDSFHKKFFGGFKESQDFGTGFARAQKPWAKRLKKLEKARRAYHKVSRREHQAQEREVHAQGNPDVAIEKQRRVQEEREVAQQESDKAFLSIHKHLDVTTNESVKAVYNELHNTLMAIDDQEDLRWWKNTYGPGMPTDWPQFQECAPETKTKKKEKVRALYDYDGQETDELSFKSGEEFLKIEDEDDQGWCRGVLEGGREGLYPANYVEV
ncbi:hypothetical protein CRUP_018078, partial [Coryphaenoides rupestris]